MRVRMFVWCVAGALVAAAATGAAWAKKRVDPGLYEGQEPAAAAAALLQLAEEEAGGGSWERILVARVHLLAGRTADGERILESVIGPKTEANEWIRIGRVYYEMGDWERARDAFAKVLEIRPGDEDLLAEIGAYYNLQGDRDTAEEYFRRSLAESPGDEYNLAMIAGSYVGVVPDP